MKSRIAMRMLAVMVGLLAVAMPGVAAGQQSVDLTCVGSGSGRADPGVTLSPSPQHITGVLKAGSALSPITPCTSLSGTPYQGATFELDGAGTLSCLGGAVSGTAKVTWDNGDLSTGEWSLNLPIFFLPIFDFRFTGGALQGARAFLLGAPTSITGTCVLNPATRLGGVGVGLIVRP